MDWTTSGLETRGLTHDSSIEDDSDLTPSLSRGEGRNAGSVSDFLTLFLTALTAVLTPCLSPFSGGSSEVCESGSCCSRPWELGIRDLVHRDFRRRLVDNTDQVKSLLHRQATAVQGQSAVTVHSPLLRLAPVGQRLPRSVHSPQ